MIEEIGYFLIETNVRELPLVALLTERTHVELVTFLTRLDGDRVGVHRENAVEEHEDANHSRGEQPTRVET